MAFSDESYTKKIIQLSNSVNNNKMNTKSGMIDRKIELLGIELDRFFKHIVKCSNKNLVKIKRKNTAMA